MIVDAADHVRTVIAAVFAQDARFTVVGTAADAAAAVDCAERAAPDVALLDRCLRGVDGLATLPRIRAVAPDCVVIVLSGDDSPPHRSQARTAGAAAVVVKGLAPRRLADEVWRILEHPAVAPPDLDGTDRDPVSMQCAPVPESAPAARRFVREALADWQHPEVVDDVVLLTCELVTNAIVHARTPSTLTIHPREDRVRVTVEDPGHGTPRMDDHGEQQVSGRGLHLVETLAHSWCTVASHDRKMVWFER